MWLSLLVCQFGLVLFSEAQNPCFSHSTFREPGQSMLCLSLLCCITVSHSTYWPLMLYTWNWFNYWRTSKKSEENPLRQRPIVGHYVHTIYSGVPDTSMIVYINPLVTGSLCVPANSDISVICGTRTMELTILLCPIYYGGYNESLMSLNAQYYRPECYGIPDWSADPPVLKFNFSITEEAISTCSNKLKVSQLSECTA